MKLSFSTLGCPKYTLDEVVSTAKDNGYEVTVKLADGTAFPRAGRITFADTRVNPATGSYEMRAELPNRDLALKPGQFVRVQLKGALRKDAIAVPQSAVLAMATSMCARLNSLSAPGDALRLATHCSTARGDT